MAKYLIVGSYSTEGAKGLLREGGTARRSNLAKLIEGLGGRLESFYFAFGSDDAYAVVDLPNNISAASLGLAVGASGAATIRTVVLLTPEDIDEAASLGTEYRPPGQ
ncbi:MAG: GYD domain-containing protein [Acidimicrobiia bacterium]